MKNKGVPRSDAEKKEKELTDMERMQRVRKQLTNEIIDLKKNKGEGKKPFNPFMKKRIDFSPQIPPTSSINIDDLQWIITVMPIMQTLLKEHSLSS